MATESNVVDLCTPPHTPVAKSKSENGKRESGRVMNGGNQEVEYTLKPTTRAYASSARYILLNIRESIVVLNELH